MTDSDIVILAIAVGSGVISSIVAGVAMYLAIKINLAQMAGKLDRAEKDIQVLFDYARATSKIS